MIRIIVFSFLLFPFTGFSQQHINQNKATVKKELEQYLNDNAGINAKLSETDTSLVLMVTGGETEKSSFVYFFDKQGKCRSQKTTAGSDSSINKYLQDVLTQEKYKWRKINGNQYISSFEEKLLIETPADGKEFAFLIIRTDWSKILYDMMVEIKQ